MLTMRISKDQIPAKINVPGAVARQATDFGDATGYGKMGGEYFSLGAGTDIAPLLKGLKDDVCHAPHWGYMLSGKILVDYGDRQETIVGGQAYYVEPGHKISFLEDSEAVEFTPTDELRQTLDAVRSSTEQDVG